MSGRCSQGPFRPSPRMQVGLVYPPAVLELIARLPPPGDYLVSSFEPLWIGLAMVSGGGFGSFCVAFADEAFAALRTGCASPDA